MEKIREHEEILKLLRHAWAKSPELRLCQLLSNLCQNAGGYPDLFYVTDGYLKEVLKEAIE